MSASSAITEDKATGLWGQLPSFDPSNDDIREYTQKCRFLHGVFPEKDRPNLAPRLAMMCKGTAWSQVRNLDPSKLLDGANGVNYLLEVLSTWEETSELKTFELFEKALYRITQKNDEATHSFSLRLNAAFDDLGGQVTVKDMQAFVMLRQSALSNEDKKKVLAMTNGEIKLKGVEQAMRTLSTKVLFGTGEVKKKIYPTNYVDTDETFNQHEGEQVPQSTFHVSAEEDEALTAETVDYLAGQGDEDALMVQQFERDLEDMFQDVPDLQTALVSYQEARQRINDRRRGRGFWPSKSRGKGFGQDSSYGRGRRKGGQKGGKDELLARISRTHCKLCGALGHWKAECPQKKEGVREQANVVDAMDGDLPHEELPQVIFENNYVEEARIPITEVCCFVHSPPKPSESIRIPCHARHHAIRFLESRLDKYKLGYKGKINGVNCKMPEPANIHRKQNKNLCQKTSPPEAECLASRSTRPCAQTTGMAILDTGASRSVIGIEHVPSVLRKLPPNIREQIREVPSQIGFRFGNNQVEYSFKQLQIPLEHGQQRIWLLVEVVPKATPFLLSIKAMKSLGASIDLENNTCYLKKLNRSLPLRENTNGLFVIDMFDLCRNPDKLSTASAAFVASSPQLIAPPGLDPPSHSKDAIETGSSGRLESVVRGSDGELEGALLHVVHSHESLASHRGDAGAGHDSNPAADQRGEGSTNEDHRVGRTDPTSMLGPSSEIQWTYVGKPGSHYWLRSMGDDRDGGRVQPTSKCWSGPKYFPTNALDTSASDEHEDCGHSSGSCSSQDIKGTSQPCSTSAFGKRSSRPHKPCFGKSGRKLVSWGRKHQGKTFEWTYNNDQGYVKWLLARKDSMTEDAEDFGNYAITRQRLESAALNSGPM